MTGIRIIPDDSSSDSKKFDKLRIDSIQVVESGITASHTCWVAENVGWIGIGYTEEQEQNRAGGRKGRTVAEISKTAGIDYTTNVVRLEVAIRTNTPGDESENSDEVSGAQFRGSLKADFHFINSKGESDKLENVDVVQAMYQYMNKKPTTSDTGAVSNSSLMFRENHTDRFMVDIVDVQKMVSIDMMMTQKDEPYEWNIGGISISVVNDGGSLMLNKFDEYEYSRTTPSTQLCTQSVDKTPAYHPILKKQKPVPLNVILTDNEIQMDKDYNTIASALTREPASQNDELNVYAFPSVNIGDPVSKYDLEVLINYAHAYGPMYETGGKMECNTDGDRPVFYLQGLKASGMIDLSKIKLSAGSKDGKFVMADMDFAIVQQVRDGVVIANYFVSLGNENAYYSVAKYPSTGASSVGYKNVEVLTFQLGETTRASSLFAERLDVACALRYKMAYDPTGKEYMTPYIYLTDQEILKIRAGQIVDLSFSQMFVGEVTGVAIAGIGDISATVDAASVATYRVYSAYSSAEPDQIGYYSFGNGISLSASPVIMQQTAKAIDDTQSVRSVEFAFTTAAASENYESGTTTPVWMKLYTADKDGRIRSTGSDKEKKDIRMYLVDGSGNFATGKTQVVRFMVSGAQELRRIEIEPQTVGGGGNAGWSLDSVTVRLGDTIVTRSVGERIYEGSPRRVTLADVTLKAKVYNYNPSTKQSDMTTVDMEGADMIAVADEEFYIEPQVFGSDMGFTVSAVEVMDDTYTSTELTDLLEQGTGNRYIFTPPEMAKTKHYRLTVASVEVPESKLVVNLKVVGTEDAMTGDEYREANE